MRVRATLRIRNDKMLAARAKLGLSQIDTAKVAGVVTAHVTKLERFDFGWGRPETVQRAAERIAECLDLPVEDIMPAELRGHSIIHTVSDVREIDTAALINFTQPKLLNESNPETIALASERSRLLIDLIDSLTERERDALKMRYGIDGHEETSLREIGEHLRVSRERVRQIIAKAERKLAGRFAKQDIDRRKGAEYWRDS